MHSWAPTASIENLKLRGEVLAKIRAFFAERNVLEVETPLLCHATVTDVHLQSFTTDYLSNLQAQPEKLYLQTSPEFAMKRLLAAGSGSIFQICKAFRNDGELGRLHNPEFTMLEWYRPDFTHHDLMQETDQLLQTVLKTKPSEYLSYADIFAQHADINPHTCSVQELKNRAIELNLTELQNFTSENRDDWLHLLMTHLIEPQLGIHQPSFIYDFPVSQAALSRIRHEKPPVAERFEVYIQGLELANGFHELTDANEQKQRFVKDLQKREALNYPTVPIDHLFLEALHHGLPSCSGIALGIDRLVMLATKAKKLDEVISFSLVNA